ncbi:nnp-1 protein putative nuclear protein 1 nop52 [Anaeramoeba flamelloides]|uniref:Nnp-1 protein putative nuclear protein 1 nop52 n=1 Tax=Anaeramoeba flamelloides TaxID=1746091 RepID=A0ABQ8YUI8_9EUKA|nr:nnp-1 protein putative nuclear protein 1 nop52 [Anaeramoeba flamelloides]
MYCFKNEKKFKQKKKYTEIIFLTGYRCASHTKKRRKKKQKFYFKLSHRVLPSYLFYSSEEVVCKKWIENLNLSIPKRNSSFGKIQPKIQNKHDPQPTVLTTTTHQKKLKDRFHKSKSLSKTKPNQKTRRKTNHNTEKSWHTKNQKRHWTINTNTNNNQNSNTNQNQESKVLFGKVNNDNKISQSIRICEQKLRHSDTIFNPKTNNKKIFFWGTVEFKEENIYNQNHKNYFCLVFVDEITFIPIFESTKTNSGDFFNIKLKECTNFTLSESESKNQNQKEKKKMQLTITKDDQTQIKLFSQNYYQLIFLHTVLQLLSKELELKNTFFHTQSGNLHNVQLLYHPIAVNFFCLLLHLKNNANDQNNKNININNNNENIKNGKEKNFILNPLINSEFNGIDLFFKLLKQNELILTSLDSLTFDTTSLHFLFSFFVTLCWLLPDPIFCIKREDFHLIFDPGKSDKDNISRLRNLFDKLSFNIHKNIGLIFIICNLIDSNLENDFISQILPIFIINIIHLFPIYQENYFEIFNEIKQQIFLISFIIDNAHIIFPFQSQILNSILFTNDNNQNNFNKNILSGQSTKDKEKTKNIEKKNKPLKSNTVSENKIRKKVNSVDFIFEGGKNGENEIKKYKKNGIIIKIEKEKEKEKEKKRKIENENGLDMDEENKNTLSIRNSIDSHTSSKNETGQFFLNLRTSKELDDLILNDKDNDDDNDNDNYEDNLNNKNNKNMDAETYLEKYYFNSNSILPMLPPKLNHLQEMQMNEKEEQKKNSKIFSIIEEETQQFEKIFQLIFQIKFGKSPYDERQKLQLLLEDLCFELSSVSLDLAVETNEFYNFLDISKTLIDIQNEDSAMIDERVPLTTEDEFKNDLGKNRIKADKKMLKIVSKFSKQPQKNTIIN